MNTKDNDAINLLIKDHNDVKEMFQKYEKLTDKSKVGKKKLANQICEALTLHTEVEEEIFYPAAREEINDDELMDEALAEHAAAKELIAQIEGMEPDDDLYDAKITVLSEQIIHHVEEEETQMFPKVRKSKLDLALLAEEITKFKEDGGTNEET
jgi:hemerythrin superfamily protein